MADDFADVSPDVSSSPAPEAAAPSQSAGQSQSHPQQSSQPSMGQTQQPAGYWDRFKSLPEFQGQDDRAIATRLYQAMEREKVASKALAQYQQVLPYAQEFLSNRREFEAWKKSQAQAQAPQPPAPQPEKAKWWNPPEVREGYKRYLTKDEDGREIIDPSAPLDARHSLIEYQQYKADFARKFLENPEQALGPMVQDLAAKQAQEIFQQTMSQRENESFVSSVEEENKDWLFDSETGNVTPEGLLVHKYIEQARSSGINGPQARWDYAIAMTERDLLAQQFDQSQQQQGQMKQSLQQFMAQQAQRPAPQPEQPRQPDVAQQNMQYLRREASRNPSRSAGTANTDIRAPKPKMTFEQMLRDDASSRGFI